jgi:hypothetical protein
MRPAGWLLLLLSLGAGLALGCGKRKEAPPSTTLPGASDRGRLPQREPRPAKLPGREPARP